VTHSSSDKTIEKPVKAAAKAAAKSAAAAATFGMNMPMMSSAFDTSMWLNAA
jgi:hypothetical protein